MITRLAPEARGVLTDAIDRAHRLGHHFLGAEHLLLALAATDSPAGSVLRESGVTAQRMEGVLLGWGGRGRDRLDTLDADALTSVGIDLDAVRAALTDSFGPEALRTPDPVRGRFHFRRPQRFPKRGNGMRFTRRVTECLDQALRGRGADDSPAERAGVADLALVVVGLRHGAVPSVLAALGVPAGRLATAIRARYPDAA
ncbi:MAG TPA: Clp protease N-terminal domain-containing protein [Pseudonocardiaceae bacterium]|nr:Clp protease N-terminal domain-containing protein [Pseudonocardiaceae bacterium]